MPKTLVLRINNFSVVLRYKCCNMLLHWGKTMYIPNFAKKLFPNTYAYGNLLHIEDWT